MAKTKTTSETKAPEGNGGNGKATKCPVSREQFAKHAHPLLITITDGDNVVGKMVANVKTDFSSGSVGWYAGEKVVIDCGTPAKVQVGLNMTVVGSKELPK